MGEPTEFSPQLQGGGAPNQTSLDAAEAPKGPGSRRLLWGLVGLVGTMLGILFLSAFTFSQSKPPASDDDPRGISLEEAARSVPGSPEQVMAERNSTNTVLVTWKPYGLDILYHIFRIESEERPKGSAPMRLIGSSSQRRYVDENAPSRTTFYAVSAFNIWGNESQKSQLVKAETWKEK